MSFLWKNLLRVLPPSTVCPLLLELIWRFYSLCTKPQEAPGYLSYIIIFIICCCCCYQVWRLFNCIVNAVLVSNSESVPSAGVSLHSSTDTNLQQDHWEAPQQAPHLNTSWVWRWRTLIWGASSRRHRRHCHGLSVFAVGHLWATHSFPASSVTCYTLTTLKVNKQKKRQGSPWLSSHQR